MFSMHRLFSKLYWSFLVPLEHFFLEVIWCGTNTVICFIVNQEYPERLQLTYRPEEDDNSPSEDTKVATDEPNKPPTLDIVAISNEEVTGPPPPPTNNLDSEDLLVNFSPFDDFYEKWNMPSPFALSPFILVQ